MFLFEIFKKKKRLLFIGDSHTEVFSYIDKIYNEKQIKINVSIVSGATAQGIKNPYSKTNALNTFKKVVLRRNYDFIFIQLGEVDCGFLIWYRAQKYKESIEEQMRLSLTNYFDFVKWILKETTATVVLTGAILPTIKDHQDWGEIAHLRSSITANQKKRTELTLKYNEALKEFAFNNKKAIKYIDISSEIINPRTALVDDKFLNEDLTNHHLSPERTSHLWWEKIKDLVGN